MNRTSLERSLAALAVALLASSPLAAQVDFSRYVALGDSLSAGMQSSGLAADYQRYSVPALLKQQAGGGPFEQPLVSPPGLPPGYELRAVVPSVVIATRPGQGVPLNLTLARPYDNLAIPGARVHDTLTRVTDNGGLHDLILRGIGTAVQQAVALRPTFVTLWIGNNDALAAATSGIVIDGVTLTTAASFEADYRAIVAALRTTGAKMAFVTIPRVTAIPFVTTIPPFIVNPATGQPVLGPNGQPLTYIGTTAADYVLLPAQTLLARGTGIPTALGGNGQPLPDNAVLTAAEAATINARVVQFNNIIRTVANEAGAALWDVAPWFDEIATDGYHLGGITFTESYITGGIFSYDGVHPNTFGYAVAANELIKAINERHNANIPQLDLYPFFSGATLPGAAGITEDQARTARLSAKAWDSLRKSLGVPPINQLLKIKNGKPTGITIND
jgi:lysophospholipase L1-like esterase